MIYRLTLRRFYIMLEMKIENLKFIHCNVKYLLNIKIKTFCTRHIRMKVWVAKSQLSYSIVVNRLSMVFELQDEKRNLKLCCRFLPLIGILYLFFLEILSSDKNGSASLLCNLIGGKCWMVFILGHLIDYFLQLLVIMWRFLCNQSLPKIYQSS